MSGTETEAVAALVGAGAEIISELDTGVLLVRQGSTATVINYRDQMLRPPKASRSAEFIEPESFLAYLHDQSYGTTRLYGNLESRFVLALLDHRTTEDATDLTPVDRAGYRARISRKMQAWIERNGKDLSQKQFAHLLVDRMGEIAEPSGSQLREVSQRLSVNRQVQFTEAVDLHNGDTALMWAEQSEPNIEVPTGFTLVLPIFEGQDAIELDCRFSYSVDEGRLTVRYEVVDLEQRIEDAFKAICQQISDGFHAAEIWWGTP